MKFFKKNWGAVLAVLLVVGGGIVLLNPQPHKITLNLPPDATSSDPMMLANPETTYDYAFREELRIGSTTFFCRYVPNTDISCTLFVSSELQPKKAVGSGEYGLYPSPDHKRVLVIYEKQAILIDPTTLKETAIFEAPANRVLGTYTAFPTFIPHAEWLSSAKIKFSLYAPDAAGERIERDGNGNDIITPEAPPLETKIIELR